LAIWQPNAEGADASARSVRESAVKFRWRRFWRASGWRCLVPAPISCDPTIYRWSSTSRHFASGPAGPIDLIGSLGETNAGVDSVGRYGNRTSHRRFAAAEADGPNGDGRSRSTLDVVVEALSCFCSTNPFDSIGGSREIGRIRKRIPEKITRISYQLQLNCLTSVS